MSERKYLHSLLHKIFRGLKFADVKNNVRAAIAPISGVAVALGATVSAFAVETTPLPTVAITTEMLTPVVEGVVANIGVILPVGIGLFSILIGIRLIPKIIGKFLSA